MGKIPLKKEIKKGRIEKEKEGKERKEKKKNTKKIRKSFKIYSIVMVKEFLLPFSETGFYYNDSSQFSRRDGLLVKIITGGKYSNDL